MATLIDFSTVTHKVDEWLDDELGIDSQSKAFMPLMVSAILAITAEEAYDSITDGGNDRGVDALFIDDRDGKNTIHIFQFKYVSAFENVKSNFPSKEIDKILSFLTDLLDKDIGLQNHCNPVLWGKVKDAWASLERKHPAIEIHFCSNTMPMIADEQSRLRKALEKWNGVRENHYGLNDIISLFISSQRPNIDRSLKLVDKDYYDRTDGNVRALICTIDAPELIKLVANPEDPNVVFRPIFEENVRVYLSDRNNINREIISTALSEDRHLFWYLNNGITMTCSSFSYVKGSRAPIVDLKNVQIVNGGQTSNALFEAYSQDPEKVSDVLLLARIIEAKEESVGHKVSETTNSQTPIKSRDLRANSLVQRKIEAALSAKGFYYERKGNQHADKPRDKRVDAQTAGQAYLAYALDMPEVAKKDRGRVFGDLFETVFSDDLIPENLLAPLRVFKQIEIFKKDVQRKIRNNDPIDQEDLFIIDGAYHVLFAVRRICDRDHVEQFSDDAILKVEEAISVVKNCVKNNTSETFSFNRFFKDAGTRTKIEVLISNKA